jgi:hypothetical protein
LLKRIRRDLYDTLRMRLCKFGQCLMVLMVVI